MIVLDASAAVDSLLGMGAAREIDGRISRPGETMHVPHLFDMDVLASLRRRLLKRELTLARSVEALEDYLDLELTRYPHLPLAERIWDLRSSVSAFDAAYLALAEALDAPLITTDPRLSMAHGHKARVELYA